MHRFFTAIEIPEQIVQGLNLLQGGVPGARWINPGNMHLTLNFIGDQPGHQLTDIDVALSALELPGFALSLAGAGRFGKRGRGALWVGVSPCQELIRLQRKCADALSRIGVELERRKFTPHVTLARFNRAPDSDIESWCAGHGGYYSAPFPVGRFGLYSSQSLRGGGPYVAAQFYPLAVV